MTMKKTLPMKRKLLSNFKASMSELKNMDVKAIVVGPRYNIVHMNKKTMMEKSKWKKWKNVL
jgi:hypothetical protein